MAMSPDDMVPSGPESAGLAAIRKYLTDVAHVPVNAGNIRRALEQNARDPGSMEANGPNLGPTVLNLRNAGIEDASPMPQGGGGGRTSAPPTPTNMQPSVQAVPTLQSDSAASVPLPPGVGGAPDSSNLMQTLAPLLAGGGAAAFPLGRYILDRARAGGAPGVAPPIVPAPAAVEAGPRLSTTGPGFAPEYGGGGTVPSGPGFDPEYSPARPATPPTQPAPGPRVPPVEPVVPPVAPTGAGFSPEYGNPTTAPVPETPASAAVDRAVSGEAPAPRAKVRGRVGVRIRPPRL